MTNPVIPADAVEAATDALVASKLGDHPGINGEEFVEAAMAALEAAAPHMAAAAWDEGYEGAVDAYDGRNVSNPYREEPNGDD